MGPGLYVHVPFCEKICHYCDFNTYLLRDGGVDDYLRALAREAALYAPGLNAAGVTFATVFIGGGTPTALSAAQLSRLLDTIHEAFSVREGAEISVEANPGTLTDKKLRALRAGGVNRISLGVQSLNDELLHALGRIHTSHHARDCYERARNIGFDNISLDLMFGLPEQDAADWRRTVETVASWRPDHLSCYGLIIEPGTLFAELDAAGRLPLPDEDEELSMYEFTLEHLGARGYEHYEVANWALPGKQSRHNRIYWENGEWLGLGPGAHSQWGGERFANVRLPADYATTVKRGEKPVDFRETIDETTAREDTMMLGLRLREGVSDAAFAQRFGLRLTEAFGPVIDELLAMELVGWEEDRLRITDRGLFVANQVFQRFISLPE